MDKRGAAGLVNDTRRQTSPHDFDREGTLRHTEDGITPRIEMPTSSRPLDRLSWLVAASGTRAARLKTSSVKSVRWLGVAGPKCAGRIARYLRQSRTAAWRGRGGRAPQRTTAVSARRSCRGVARRALLGRTGRRRQPRRRRHGVINGPSFEKSISRRSRSFVAEPMRSPAVWSATARPNRAATGAKGINTCASEVRISLTVFAISTATNPMAGIGGYWGKALRGVVWKAVRSWWMTTMLPPASPDTGEIRPENPGSEA